MAQLLFLDTFSHEDTELNLDLVQFPSSVIVDEVRVIPLGGKVHLNGKNMRLGATLPNKFNLEFFVNDLTKPTASTFSSLGKLDYDHHCQICLSTSTKKIRTDGLVLRGHYKAVTLAVYGNFTPTTAEELALLSSAAAAASGPAPPPEPEPEQIVNQGGSAPAVDPHHPAQSHHIQMAQQKRNDWTSSWPPPVADNCSAPAQNATPNPADHYGASHPTKKDWKMGNGQRAASDEFYDHHTPTRHHHSSSALHKQSQHHTMPRPRSPQRESRSGTRSPPRRHQPPRRSVTPKSPPPLRSPPGPTAAPNNGYAASPPEPTRKRGPPSEEEDDEEEEPPILDDVSDISDGDIPMDDMAPDNEVEEDDEKEEMEMENSKEPLAPSGPAPASTVEAALVNPLENQDDEKTSGTEDTGSVKHEREALADIPEDMEEISDEEADWSDDGDCFFLDSLVPCDVEFGKDWVDPVALYRVEDYTLTHLQFYSLYPQPPSSEDLTSFDNDGNSKPDQSSGQTSDEIRKLANLQTGYDVTGSEWVESLEAIKTSQLSTSSSENLLPIIRRGLSLTEALKHPVHTFKVRHLKASLKFTIAVLALPGLEWSGEDISEIMEALFKLILDETVAAPLRVQCVLALHHALNQPSGLASFFKKTRQNNWCSDIVNFMASRKLTTRLKVSLTSVLQRIALSESFEELTAEAPSASLSLEDCVSVLKQILSTLKAEDLPILSFLANDKCGVLPYVLRDMHNMNFLRRLAKFFQSHLKDDDQNGVVIVVDTLEELFEAIVKRPSGLLFLASYPGEMDQLLSSLLEWSNSSNSLSNGGGETFEFVQLCLHALIRIDQMSFLCKASDHERLGMETPEMLAAIKDLYGMTFQPVGRRAIVHVLSMSELLKPIIALVKHSGEVDEEHQEEKKDMKKSAIRGYACEILLMVVRLSDQIDYLHFYSDELLTIGKSDENSKLFELTSWLQWMSVEGGVGGIEWTSLEYSATPKVDLASVDFIMTVVKQNMDKISPLSCDLVMAIRFLHQVVNQEPRKQQQQHQQQHGQQHQNHQNQKSFGTTAGAPHPSLLAAFSLDFCEHGISILNKVCGYHEQPHLHTATFAGYNGHLLMIVIRLIVRLLKDMFGQRMSCLDEGHEGHDTNAIPTMLKTFALCTVVSKNSDAYLASLETCSDIVELLITYTSVPVDMSKEKTTVWQRMVTNIVKYVTMSPHTYLPGLKLLAEVLPLPLPVVQVGPVGATDKAAMTLELSHLMHQRNMWSAQLYGMESELKDMIVTLLPCRVRQVQRLLDQVGHQMADLSAPTSVIVAEALLQSLQNDPLTSYPNVVTMLTNSAAIKVAFLSLVRDNDILKALSQPAEPEILPLLALALLNPQKSLVVADDTAALETPPTDHRPGDGGGGGMNNKADMDPVQVTANTLPDRENSILLMNAVMASEDAPLWVEVVDNLSKSLLGLLLLRGSLLRHKSETSRKLESLDKDTLKIDTVARVFLALSKYLSQTDLRDMVNWTATTAEDDDEQQQHIFLCEKFRQIPSTQELTKILKGSNDDSSHDKAVEELDFEWPASELLLDQFSQRTTVVVRVDPRPSPASVEHEIVQSEVTSDSDDVGVSVSAAADLLDLIESTLSKDFDIQQHVKQVCDEKSLESERQKKKAAKKSLLESKALANKNLISSYKAGGTLSMIRGGRSVFNRGPGGQRPDLFRSRPPNTSRPPSLHVDDFLVLQSRGQQPTGPTGYNKQSLRAAQELFAEKEAKSKGSVVGFREATKEPVFDAGSSQLPPSEGGPRLPRGPPTERTSGSGVSKNYRGNSAHGPSGNGRTFNRDRYGGSSSNMSSGGGSRGGGGANSSRGWNPSPSRDNRNNSGGRSASDHRHVNHPRRNGRGGGGGGESRRGGGGGKDRLKGKPGSRNVRSVPR